MYEKCLRTLLHHGKGGLKMICPIHGKDLIPKNGLGEILYGCEDCNTFYNVEQFMFLWREKYEHSKFTMWNIMYLECSGHLEDKNHFNKFFCGFENCRCKYENCSLLNKYKDKII
jgi:hypothetical protein